MTDQSLNLPVDDGVLPSSPGVELDENAILDSPSEQSASVHNEQNPQSPRPTTTKPSAKQLAAEAQSHIGQIIDGRYEILDKIAHGGMATVYRAFDRHLDREVAIKLMHPHLANGPEGATFISRFRREAKAAARLHHPSIVTVFDQGIDDSIGYLTMEYVDGTNLRARLKDLGTFTIGDALTNIASILRALAAAHRSGLVHRDIKPENVLIDKSGTLKITDFGLARVVTEMSTSTTGTVFGTVAYLAPEIIETGASDSRSDIYSVGIMLYELIAGKQPYESTTPIQVAFKHVNEDVPHLTNIFPEVPNKVALIIDVFCARDEAKRPKDAAAALELLNKVARELTTAELLVQLPRPKTYDSDKMQNVNPELPDVSVSDVSNTLGNAEKIAEDKVNLADYVDDSVDLPFDNNASGDATVVIDNNSPKTYDFPDYHDDEVVVPSIPHESSSQTRVMNEQDILSTNQLSGSQLASLRDSGDHNRKSDTDETAQNIDSDGKHPLSKRARIIIFAILGVLVAILIGLIIWWYEMFGPGSQVTVPYGISHVSKQSAEDILKGANIGSYIEEQFSDDIKAGDVIATEPGSGDKVSKYGRGVKLVVSKGIQKIDIPDDITSNSVEKAIEILKKLGFDNISTPEHAFNKDVEKDKVISITPGGGSKEIAHNEQIKIVISDGPKPSPMPDLRGMSIDNAIATLEEIGVGYSRNDVYSDDVAEGKIISQNTDPGATVYDGGTVSLTVSRGSEFVVMPDLFKKDIGEAKQILEASGLKCSISGDDIVHIVQKQSVSAGTKVKRGETIILTVV